MEKRPPWSVILFNRIVPLFDPSTLDRVNRALGPPLRYPDGSLQFDYANSDDAKWSMHDEMGTTPLFNGGLIKLDSTRGLAAFGDRWFTIIYGGEYCPGEDSFLCGVSPKEWPAERNLANLQFTVMFRRRLSQATRDAFMEDFSKHFLSLSSGGLFSEGPLMVNPPEVRFREKRADMWLDARNSGQLTVMSLILRALEFGHEVATVEMAVFNYNDPTRVDVAIETNRNVLKQKGLPIDEAAEQEYRQEWEGRGPTIILPLRFK